jgi:hypothetical protein
MIKIHDEKRFYSPDETDKGNKHSYNTLERILFLLIILIITVLGLVIAVPLFVLAQARALLLPKKNN